MPFVHYRPAAALAASLSLLLAACGATPPPAAAPGPQAAATGQQVAATSAGHRVAEKLFGQMDTEATLWTVLGLRKKGDHPDPGPQTGSNVSPVLWQATLDTLKFMTFASTDPLGGSLVTDWYSPKDKPDERFRIDVFILSRYLNSDSVAVTIDRQVRQPDGQWADSTVSRKVQNDLETKILYRARQLRREWIATASG